MFYTLLGSLSLSYSKPESPSSNGSCPLDVDGQPWDKASGLKYLGHTESEHRDYCLSELDRDLEFTNWIVKIHRKTSLVCGKSIWDEGNKRCSLRNWECLFSRKDPGASVAFFQADPSCEVHDMGLAFRAATINQPLA